MFARRLLSGVFGALFSFYTAAVVGLTPGTVDISLVFPLNDTYAPQDGPLPIVFELSSQPFQPALVSTLGLRLTYLLTEIGNYPHRVVEGNLDLGSISASSADNPHYIVGYSDKLAGREAQFELQCYISSILGFTSVYNATTKKYEPGTIVVGGTIGYLTYFTTQSGAKPAEVPSTTSNGSDCLPHGGWSMGFNVSEYKEVEGHTYGFMAPESVRGGSKVPCAVEVDGATAASITAGMAAAATASPSSSSAAAGSARTLSSSGPVAAVWSVLVLGLSVVLFIR